MTTLEKTLILACIVIPMLCLLLWFQTDIRDWQSDLGKQRITDPGPAYTCIVRRDPLWTCPAYWCKTKEEAVRHAKENGYNVLGILVWERGSEEPRELK